MPIQIAARHVEVTDDIRQDIRARAEHWLRIFDGLQTIHVTLSAEKQRRVAEFVANVSHGPAVVARVAADDLMQAIHDAAEKIETQLRRHKDRVRDHRPREGEAEPAPASVEELRNAVGAGPEEPETAEGHDAAQEEAR